MNEPKFTKGPWTRLPIKGECSIDGDDYRLMLAAPELYEALQMYVSAYSLGFPSPNILVEAGQKALAKARGEK